MGKLAYLLPVLLAATGLAAPAVAQSSRSSGMRSFSSDQQFIKFMRRVAQRQRMQRQAESQSYAGMPPPPPPPPPPSPEAAAAPTAVSSGSDKITNTQEADVDEGGIVKVAGKNLVILRRGRLFTVSLADRGMRPIDHIDAFPPGTSGNGAWYDEMLVSGDRIIVVGFSYTRGGTEINRFRVSSDGKLRFEDSYHLRSNDYYSSSNYASRLIGTTLIFYTPLYLRLDAPLTALPGLQRWSGDPRASFERTLPATRLYVPAPISDGTYYDVSTLHTVTTCDLALVQLSCRSTAVLGSSSRTFYVSGKAVYVWTSKPWSETGGMSSLVYRLPLDGSTPSAIRAWGSPVDQFSFAEDRSTGVLNVVVRADAAGDAMWRPERSSGSAALLTLPIAAFGDGSRTTRATAYRPLSLNKEPWSFHNRFVGQYLIYSAGEFDPKAGVKTVFAVPLDGRPIAQIAVPHGVDRIDIIGRDAIAIGNDAKARLGFSAIELNDAGRLGDTYFLPAAREGERRSQAFFYRPDDNSLDGASGMLGLPVTRDLDQSRAARFLGAGSAVAFLRRDNRRFSPAGELVANTQSAVDDACQASCVDWYGNARPIFLGDRVFALMGYELVEGRVSEGLIGERARVDFAPTKVQ